MPFVESLFEPLLYFVDSSKRLFYVYLFSSFVLALLILYFNKGDLVKSCKDLFHKRLWTHFSTQLDIKLLFFNSILRALLFLVVALSSVGVARVTVRVLYDLFPQHEPSSGYAMVMVLYTVTSFVLLDFSRFFQHYLFHKIPWLWQFHKIHHSAQVLTPLTLYRTHPVESLISSLRRILVIGLVSGVFIFCFRSLISVYAIFGVNALDFLFNIFGSNLRHSHVWLSFGPLNHIFISPAQHQIHHSRSPLHHDKNFGFALSLWDKIFGSFYQVHKKEFLIFGVRGERYKGLWEALKAPFV